MDKRERATNYNELSESFILEILFEMSFKKEISWINTGKGILEDKRSLYKETGYYGAKCEPVRDW